MAKTTLIEYGTSVLAGPYDDEEIIAALGDGVAIPGDFVHIGSDRKVAGSDLGAVELWSGILLESRITGREAAIVSGIRCEVVIPISTHRYNVRILDLNGDKDIGFSLDISATPGKLDAAVDVNNALCGAAKPIDDDDTVAQVRMR